VAAGLLLLGAFAVTGAPASGSRWFERGAAVAGLMAAEPWRAVTALTLHVDAAHAAGNAVATAVLFPAIGQRLGVGLAMLAMVGAGAGGNVLAALLHAPPHAAVGASTATFAAIGLLGVLGFVGRGGGRRSTWKRWTIPAASLVLLSLLGAARDADVLAHATGFACGAVTGLAAALVRRPAGTGVQVVAGLLALLAVAASWRVALQ
jgi:membrane associated rhomboid family serine protease